MLLGTEILAHIYLVNPVFPDVARNMGLCVQCYHSALARLWESGRFGHWIFARHCCTWFLCLPQLAMFSCWQPSHSQWCSALDGVTFLHWKIIKCVWRWLVIWSIWNKNNKINLCLKSCKWWIPGMTIYSITPYLLAISFEEIPSCFVLYLFWWALCIIK